MADDSEMIGWFAVPADYLDELRELEAAANDASNHRPTPDYHAAANRFFERAREVATASAVFELKLDAYRAFWDWFERRLRKAMPYTTLGPDECAALAERLLSVPLDNVARWAQEHADDYPEAEPAEVVELARMLTRVVASATPSKPLGFIEASFLGEYRHPNESPELMGWFAVPAEHLTELQDIVDRRDDAFRQNRPEDFYRHETFLFERARELAITSAVFDDKKFRDTNEVLWQALAGAHGTRMPTLLDADERLTWINKVSRASVEGVTRGGGPAYPELLGELLDALVRVMTTAPSRRLGFVMAWSFAAPPAHPEYDAASRRVARIRATELKGLVREARARLGAIATRQRRAAARKRRASAGDRSEARGNEASRTVTTPATTPGAPALPRADIEATGRDLEARFPWLSRLSNCDDIVAVFARPIAWTRMASRAAKKSTTKKSAARSTTATRDQAARMLESLPARVPIALRELLADDFLAGATAMERAGRAAMVEELARHQGAVELAMPRGKPDVRVYIDTVRLRLHDGALYRDAFFARGGGALLAMQSAYYTAVLERGEDELRALYQVHGWLVGLFIQERVGEMIAADRRAYIAREMGDKPDQKLSPEELERFLANDDARDLFVQLFPGSKAAEMVAHMAAKTPEADSEPAPESPGGTGDDLEQ